MSQAGEIDITGTHPEIPTEFVEDVGTAVPIANILEILGTYVNAHNVPVQTLGSGNTVTITTQLASANGSSVATKAGLASFDSGVFTVDANGFVSLVGSSAAIEKVNLQTGTTPIVPVAGAITLNGAVVASGTHPIRTDGTGANTAAIEVQISQAIAATDATKIGLCNFDSGSFSVDANGFVTLKGGSEAIDSIGVDATSGTGTNPVLPTAAGLITVNGATVSAGTHPIRTVSTAPNVYQIQAQISQAIAGTDVTKIGLSAFDSSIFSVDANGFVTLTTGNPDLHDSIYIVGQDLLHGANYTTIASAYAAAVASGVPSTVFIQPGTYNENLTISANVNLCAHVCDAYTPNVKIVGKLTASYSGSVSISGIQFQTNSDYCIVQSGSNACTLRLINCYLNVTNNTAINITNSNSSSLLELIDCKQETTGSQILFTHSGASTFNILGGIYNRITGPFVAGASTISGTGSVNLFGCSYFANAITASVHGTVTITLSYLSGALNISGDSSTSLVSSSIIYSGTDPAITIGSGIVLPVTNVNISTLNASAITGAGTLIYGGIQYHLTSIIDVTTQNALVVSNDALRVKSPVSYPYTVVTQDAVVVVDTSSARTVNMPASPTTGQKHTIKDAVGSGALNNITLQGNGNNIEGSASLVMSANWQSVTLVYSTTYAQWLII